MDHKAVRASGSVFGHQSPCISETLCNSTLRVLYFPPFQKTVDVMTVWCLSLSNVIQICVTITTVSCAPQSPDRKAGTTQDGNTTQEVFHQLEGSEALVKELLHNMEQIHIQQIKHIHRPWRVDVGYNPTKRAPEDELLDMSQLTVSQDFVAAGYT